MMICPHLTVAALPLIVLAAGLPSQLGAPLVLRSSASSLPLALIAALLLLAASCKRVEQEWSLDEHWVRGEEADFVAVTVDCRGANRLRWRWMPVDNDEVEFLRRPDRLSYGCVLTPRRPLRFSDFGPNMVELRVWPHDEQCTPELAEERGWGGDCDQFVDPLEGELDVDGPWCGLRFGYDEPASGVAHIVTYCHRP